MKRDSFIFYRSYFEAIKDLPAEERLEIYDALINYAMEGIENEITPPTAKSIFILIKPLIISNNKKYNIGKKYGVLGKKYGKLGGCYGNLGGRPKNPPETPPTTPANVDVDVEVLCRSNKTNEINKNLVSNQDKIVSSLNGSSPQPTTTNRLSKEFFDKWLDVAEKLSVKKLEQESRAK